MNDTWWVDIKDLDEFQQSVIDTETEASVVVTGPPGSGKTNLVLLRAKYLTRAGRANLRVVVFTRSLCDFLRSGARRYGIPEDRIVTCMGFLRELLAEFGSIPQGLDKVDFLTARRKIADSARTLISDQRIRNLYDCILIDETQDLLTEEVQTIQLVGNHVFAVADKMQKIYDGDDGLSTLMESIDNTLELRYHYRNGLNVCRFADELVRATPGFSPLADWCNYPESDMPSTVRLVKSESLEQQWEYMHAQIRQQLKAYPGEQIGILIPRLEEARVLHRMIWESKFHQTTVFLQSSEESLQAYQAEYRIVLSTIHGAKGLEFRALHIAGLEKLGNFRAQRKIVYTAATRAKTSLSMYFTGSVPGYVQQAYQSINPPPDLPSLPELFDEK